MAFFARLRSIGDLLATTAKAWVHDRAPRHAATISFYALFAMGPLLLLSIALAGLVFGEAAVREAVVAQIGELVGEEGEGAVRELMEGRQRDGGGLIGLFVGLAVLLFGAAAVFRQLRRSLNQVWEIEQRRPEGWKRKLKEGLRRNLLGFAGVMGVGFLLLVSLVISTVLSVLGQHAQDLLPGTRAVWQGILVLVSTLTVGLLFTFLFRCIPDAVVAWKDVAVGGFVTGVLFVVGQQAIALYFATAATASRYGAAGSVIVLLLWVYFSSLIVLFGAELTQVYANRHGQAIRPGRMGITQQEAAARRVSRPWEEGT